jgi:hypothetical protein
MKIVGGESEGFFRGFFLACVMAIVFSVFGCSMAKADSEILIHSNHPYTSGVQSGSYWLYLQRYQMPSDSFITKVNASAWQVPANGDFNWSWGILDENKDSLYDSGTKTRSEMEPNTGNWTMDFTPASPVFVSGGDYFYFFVKVANGSSCSGYSCVGFALSSDSATGDDRVKRCLADFTGCDPVSNDRWLNGSVFVTSPTCSNTPALCLTENDCENEGWVWKNGTCREDSTPLAPTLAQSPLYAHSSPFSLLYTCTDGGDFYGFNSGTGNGQGPPATLSASCLAGETGRLYLPVNSGENLWKIELVDGQLTSPEATADIYWNPVSGTLTAPWLEYTSINVQEPEQTISVHCTNSEHLARSFDGGSQVTLGDCVTGATTHDSIPTLTIGFHQSCWWSFDDSGNKSEQACLSIDYRTGVLDCTSAVLGTGTVPTGQTGDTGIIASIFGGIYSSLANVPIIGDLMLVNCIAYSNFYGNLNQFQALTNPSVTLSILGNSQNFQLPLTQVKSSMETWVSGITNYEDFRTTITVVIWAFIIFSVVFYSLFGDRSIKEDERIVEQTNKSFDDLDI